ncbi:perlucin-like protein [Haliotis rufescens]|uniref:perlucin-like protein n=1 Tax=Haliotis rufescens TaxID=6454 RepID=UPI001EAFB43D|nr:perlucin-like protein [Haliotis rufescens]
MSPITAVLAVCLVFPSVAADCLNGWTRFDNSCYRVYRNGTEWPLAVFDCEKKSGYLAQFETASKIQNAHALMRELNGKVDDKIWIGASDVRHENVWVWENSRQNVTIFDWGGKEPNQGSSSTQQDCVMMYGKYDFKWADDICTSHFQYLCERPLSASL